jgi:hypothetical protein
VADRNNGLDRDREAAGVANYCHNLLFQAHRGAKPWEPGAIAVFGNDGYSVGDRARKEVALLRRKLDEAGHAVLGFGVDSWEAYTWALLVSSGSLKEGTAARLFRDVLLSEDLTDLVWTIWDEVLGVAPDGCAYNRYQRHVADIVLGR